MTTSEVVAVPAVVIAVILVVLLIPLWVPLDMALQHCGRRGFILDEPDSGLSFSADAFAKAT
jgi:hypothetical protein